MADDLILAVHERLSAAYVISRSVDGQVAEVRTLAALRAQVSDILSTAPQDA